MSGLLSPILLSEGSLRTVSRLPTTFFPTEKTCSLLFSTKPSRSPLFGVAYSPLPAFLADSGAMSSVSMHAPTALAGSPSLWFRTCIEEVFASILSASGPISDSSSAETAAAAAKLIGGMYPDVVCLHGSSESPNCLFAFVGKSD